MVRNEKVGERESIDTVPLASGKIQGAVAVILCRDAACRVSGRGTARELLELNIFPRSEMGQAPSLHDICFGALGGGGRVVWIYEPVLGGCDRCSLEPHSGGVRSQDVVVKARLPREI